MCRGGGVGVKRVCRGDFVHTIGLGTNGTEQIKC